MLVIGFGVYLITFRHYVSFAQSDDEPDDGPQHYVMITGFHSPHLPGQLAEIGK